MQLYTLNNWVQLQIQNLTIRRTLDQMNLATFEITELTGEAKISKVQCQNTLLRSQTKSVKMNTLSYMSTEWP